MGSFDGGDRPLTDRERICLRFLDDKMWASSPQIGEAVIKQSPRGGSNYAQVGAAVAWRLYRRDLVTQLSDGLWRITRAGRESIGSRAAGIKE